MSDSLPFLTLFGCCAFSRNDLTAGVPEVRPAHLLQSHASPHHRCLPASQQLCKALVQFTSCHRRLAVLANASCPFDSPCICLHRLCQGPIVSFSISGDLTSTAAVLEAAVSFDTSSCLLDPQTCSWGSFPVPFSSRHWQPFAQSQNSSIEYTCWVLDAVWALPLCICLHLAIIRAVKLGNRVVSASSESCPRDWALRLSPRHLL